MKMFKILIAVCLAFSAVASQAQLAGKNVVLIQGFLPQHLLIHPADKGQADGNNYWSSFDSSLKNPSTSKILYYPSNYSLQGANGIAALIAEQLDPILSSGHCDDGCVFITHSTGDLVMRYVMANKYSLLGSELANRFNVFAFIDMAGAGGGTELANLGMDVINGVNFVPDVIETLLEWAGFNIELGLDPGVLYNLQPSVARNTAVDNIPAIPKLRIAGTGSELYGFLTHPLIKGADDSVVPLHSACGAASDNSYDSCTQNLRMDGRVTRVSNAPSSSQLYNYHYPLILSESMPHNAMQANKDGHGMTFALSGESLYNNSGIKTIGVDVEYYEYYDVWDWFHKYRVISNAQSKNMGQVILASFE